MVPKQAIGKRQPKAVFQAIQRVRGTHFRERFQPCLDHGDTDGLPGVGKYQSGLPLVVQWFDE